MVDQLEDKNPYGFKPVSSRRVSEAIFDQIREKILRGEIRPNDRLPSERALMEIFGRSRPTIREALRMLERSGLITTIPGSGGSVVKEISSQTVEQSLEGMVLQKSITPLDLYEFRTVNETANVAWAVERRTEEDLLDLRRIIKRSEACRDDWEEFFACDIDFHMAVARAGKNQMSAIVHTVISQLIADIISRGFQRLSPGERAKHRRNVIVNHKALCDAIARQDKKKAEGIIVSHLDEFRHFMIEENLADQQPV
ncbi:MAG: FadR/GntR family transcriptional regulator [Saccharofermentanales bacterium]|jgi:GntR family transcriptional repressor for pyruvate dehydrogenase complex|nr:FadR family transcriptional regulator [Clostridiaceae bacterium]